MTSLALIAKEYQQAAMVLADMDLDAATIADTLEGLSGELEVKSQAIGFLVRSIEADAAAAKEWAKSAKERAEAMEARAERLRQYLAQNLAACGIEKIEGPGIRIGWRKSSAVVVSEPALVPAEFMRQAEAPPPSPDKKALADALKAGKEVPGAHLEHRRNLAIT